MAKKKESKAELLKTIIIAGAIALGFRSFLFEPFNIPSGSMVPTLLVGDYLFVSKFSYGYSRYSFPFGIVPFSGRIAEDKPERGDVVVFRQPTDVSIAFIKRVVGLPGDRIQVKDGVLHINSVPVKRTYLGKTTARNALSAIDFKVYEESLPNGTKHYIQERSDNDSLDNTVEFTVLEDHYFISFDRLTEDDWFSHLAEKEWVNMKDLFSAFVAAYDAAGIPLSKQFFERHKDAFFRRAEEDYEILAQNLCSERVHGGKLLWSLTYAFRDSDACIDEILEDQYNFHPHSVISAIYDVGDAYSKHVVSRAVRVVSDELQHPTDPNLSIFPR